MTASVTERARTPDEIVHETAAAIRPEIIPGKHAAVIIVSEILPAGQQTRTVWRFINCEDPALQATGLRQVADMIEGKIGKLEPIS